MNIQLKTQGTQAARPLAGKVSLVTGSTSGIGLGIARALAEAGSAVVLNGFGVSSEIAKTREQISADFGVKASYSAADMTRPEAIAEMIATTVAEHGRLDVLVNNAGIQYVAPLDQFPIEKWDAILSINLSSAFHTTRLALPHMRKNKFGRIINIASAHGLVDGRWPAHKTFVDCDMNDVVSSSDVNAVVKSEPGQIVLVLQCGGALGSYQAGVYQALHEAGIAPDWIIGTSIGAINASLNAGNAPQNRVSRLQEFWKRMEQNPIWSFRDVFPGFNEKLSYWSTLANGIPGFFKPNPLAHAGADYPLGADRAGYYSTEPLEQTLTELVDFDLVNRCTPRLTVGAAHVGTSQMKYFDSRDCELGVKHVMASGALPPAFPAVRIDGELYWDGGILSTTPTEAVVDDNTRKNSLIFAVHMRTPTGAE